VAALALVACGGDEDKAMSKDEYKKEAQKIADKFETDFQAAQKNLQAGDPQEALTGIQQLGTLSGEASSKFDKLEPPEEYKDVQGRLVGSLRTLDKRADEFEQAVDAKDKARVEQAGTAFEQAAGEVEKVGQEFDKKVGTT
jgi:hypothetical protein